jgi:hypothetical protein
MDSFFSDAPNYQLNRNRDELHFGSEKMTNEDLLFDEHSLPINATRPLVLQRNNESIGNFLAGNGLLGLTIVCAVLGIITSTYHGSDGSEKDRELEFLRVGMFLKAADDPKVRCE